MTLNLTDFTTAPMLNDDDARLLRDVRLALLNPFADPVMVRTLTMSRACARMIERNLSCSSRSISHDA